MNEFENEEMKWKNQQNISQKAQSIVFHFIYAYNIKFICVLAFVMVEHVRIV